MRAYPLKLVPKLLTKPWGGRRIESVLHRKLPIEGPIGESWEVFDREGASSEIGNGALAGRRLADVRGAAPFPLMVKILDAAQKLSLQVHPDAESAARLGSEPKAECWFILHAEPGAKVARGLKEGVTRRDVEEAVGRGDAESVVHWFEVRAGDTVFVPAGAVHTIGAGVLLCEVSENSDTTYRLDDYGRGRPLHVREALESIRFVERSPDKVPAQVIEDEGAVRRELLVKARSFTAEGWVGMGTFTLELEPTPVPYQALHVLAGSGELRPFRRGVAPVAFFPGDTILLPSEFDGYEVVPGATVFRALVFRRGSAATA